MLQDHALQSGPGAENADADGRLRAALDELLDPLVLLESVRDEHGEIVDFVYADANQAACECHGVARDELIGSRLLDRLSGDDAAIMLDEYIQVVETGRPLIVNDIQFGRPGPQGSRRRYDLRAVRAGDGLTYVAREVTARYEAAAELAASEEHYRLLAENASDVVVRARNDGRIEWVSPSVTALVGWRPEEMVGRPFADFVHADDQETLRDSVGRLLSGEATRPELRILTAGGGHRWIAMAVKPLFDAAGNVAGRVAGWRDAQAEVEARAELTASRERYRLLAENSSDVVLVVDLDARVTWVSRSVTRALGWAPDEVIGKEASDLIHPDDRAALGLHVAPLRGGRAPRGDLLARALTRTGKYRWMSGTGGVVTDESGSVTGLVAGLRDVDDLVNAREKAQVDRERLRATLDSLMDPHVRLKAVRDDAGRITDFVCTDANEAAARYLHRSRDELIGARPLSVLADDAAATMSALWSHTVETGLPLALDDHVFPFEADEPEQRYDIRLVRVGDGLSCTWRDVGERYRTQLALRRRVEELDALQRIFQLLAERTSLTAALEAAGQEIETLFGAAYVHVHLLTEGAESSAFETVCATDCGPAPEEVEVIRDALASGRRAISESLGHGSRHLLGVPLTSRSKTLGVLTIARDLPASAFTARDIRVAQPVADALAAIVENERMYAKKAQQAAAQERQRLARDLHDSVTQTLYSANLIAEVLPAAWTRDPEEGLHDLEMLRRLARAAMAEMRTLLFELRPEALPSASLKDLLERLANGIAGRGRVEVDLDVDDDLELPVPVKLAFYRVAQEALNNVGKHARATRTSIRVAGEGDVVRLAVHDDGAGFDRDLVRPENMGLRIMRERAEEAGADFTIDSIPGSGTTVTVAWRPPTSGPTED